MKKIILIFIYFSLSIGDQEIIMCGNNKPYYFFSKYIKFVPGLPKVLGKPGIEYKKYYWFKINKKYYNYNAQCLYAHVIARSVSYYSGKSERRSGTIYCYDTFYYDFCKNKDECEYFNTYGWWVCKNGEVICPPGKLYDSSKFACVEHTDENGNIICPNGYYTIDRKCEKELRCSDGGPPKKINNNNYTCDRTCEDIGMITIKGKCEEKKKCTDEDYTACISKCGNNENYIKNYSCLLTRDNIKNITCECLDCNETIKIIENKCEYGIKDAHCESNSTNLNITYTCFDTPKNDENITCMGDEIIVIDETTGKIYCKKIETNNSNISLNPTPSSNNSNISSNSTPSSNSSTTKPKDINKTITIQENNNSNNKNKDNNNTDGSKAGSLVNNAIGELKDNVKVNIFSTLQKIRECNKTTQITLLTHKVDFPNILCITLQVINRPDISPIIDIIAKVITILAGIAGSLELFRKS